MDWDSYYEKFYEWATSTQIKKMSSLTSFGASAEVAEVAQEYMDEKAASRLIKKAVANGVQFTPDEIYDLSGCCDTSAMNELLKSAKCAFTQEQLEDLWGSADDDVLELVAKRNHVTMFADDVVEEASIEDKADYDEPEQIYYDSVQYPQTIQAARMAFAGIWFEDRNGDGSTDIRMAFDRNGEADNEVTLVWYWQAEDGYVFQPEESTPME